MAYKNCPMCTRYDYCMEDGRVCGVTEKLIEQWFDEKLEVLNETLDVCRQQSAFGNVFLMLSDSDIEALKSGKVLHWAGETFKCGIFVRYEGVRKMCNPSKKTIKKIDRMLESRCKEHRTFGNALKMYIFRNPTEIGLDYVTFCGKAGYFIGVSLEESGEYNFFGIYSPEQVLEVV